MTDDGLDDSARHGSEVLQDGSDGYGDSDPSQRLGATYDHNDGQASEAGESMDAPTLQADAALSLAKQFQKTRCFALNLAALQPRFQSDLIAAVDGGCLPLPACKTLPCSMNGSAASSDAGLLTAHVLVHVHRAAEHKLQETLNQDSLKPRTRFEDLADL